MNREIKIVFAYFIVLATLFFGVTMAFADCTGCGDDGHQVCPIEKKHKHVTIMKEEHKASSSEPEMGVVFAVCIFEIDETGKRVLVDHVASENLVDCLKNKREKEREYKESKDCLLYTSPSPRDRTRSRMPSSA